MSGCGDCKLLYDPVRKFWYGKVVDTEDRLT